ncbi:hypothetical protein BD779DRAFT_1467 [Infundibulicybe gibba]|nr:hypothetical protein BD779DRAFT_1467 [Infundibulicybe gibba]
MRIPNIHHLAWMTLFFTPSLAILVNVTIDDTVPDPLTGNKINYEPSTAWNSGENCQACTAHPDQSMLSSGTWHDSTFNALPGSNNFPNTTLHASAAFNGTAVYVFCALARTTDGPAGNSDMSFFIDGEFVGTFAKPPPANSSGFDYNVLVYSNTSISPRRHQLTIQNGHVNGPKSLIILDSIVYTYDDGQGVSPSPTPARASNNKLSMPAIIGVVVSIIVSGLLSLALLFLLLRRRRKSAKHKITELRPSLDEFLPGSTPLPGVVTSYPMGQSSRSLGQFQPGYTNHRVGYPTSTASDTNTVIAGTCAKEVLVTEVCPPI